MTWKLYIQCFGSLLFLIFVTVNGDNPECFVFNFEEDYEEMFDNESPACAANEYRWEIREYYSSEISDYPDGSTQFITPMNNFACTSSIPLHLSDGVLEINIHVIDSQHNVLVVQVFKPTGTLVSYSVDFSRKSEWETIKFDINNPDNDELVIVMLGEARDTSMIIDSIRHIPASLLDVADEDLPSSCKLYSDSTTTTTEITTTEITTTETTTTEPTTTETTTAETTTTETMTTETITTETTVTEPSTTMPSETVPTTTETTDTETPGVPIPPTFWNAVNIATVVILCCLALLLVVLLIFNATRAKSLESNNVKTNKSRINENMYRLPRAKYV